MTLPPAPSAMEVIVKTELLLVHLPWPTQSRQQWVMEVKILDGIPFSCRYYTADPGAIAGTEENRRER